MIAGPVRCVKDVLCSGGGLEPEGEDRGLRGEVRRSKNPNGYGRLLIVL